MMDYSAASPPGTQTPVTGVPPRLGTPVPGTTGGLPTQQGLNVSANPMAQQLQSQGRGDDKMLVHMTPGEVGGLQQLAMAHGGSLTINPQTGLPEAGFLSKLLPTLIGFGLNFIPGVGPLLAAGITAAGATAVTGDLQKGLTAGLQAFGGAGLSGALAPGATAGLSAAKAAAPSVAGGSVAASAPAAGMFSPAVTGVGTQLGPLAGGAINPALNTGAAAAGAGAKGFLGRFAAETSLGQTGLLGKALPMVAGSSVLGAVSDAMQPKLPTYNPDEEGKSTYAGPYVPGQRKVQIQPYEEMVRTGGAEAKMFTPSNPVPGFRPVSSLDEEERAEYGFAAGGLTELPVSRDLTAKATTGLPASPDFQSTMNYFNAQNPGAITASMYPTAAAPATPAAGASAGSGEQTYTFNNRPPTTTAPVPNSFNDIGYVDLPGVGNIMIPGFSGYDFGNIDFDAIARRQSYIPQAEQLVIREPDMSGIYDRFGQIENQLQNLPTPQAPDLTGIYDRFGQIENQLQNLPTPQAPDLTGVFDRFGQLESRINALPTPQATDLSGVYDRFGQLENRFNSLPTPQAPDLSGIYDRFGQLENRFNSLPTPQAPDLSGIYDRFGQLEGRINDIPATDLSGVYDRFGQLEGRINSLPTPQATDLSGIQSQIEALGGRISGLPTPQATDLTGVFDRFGQLESQFGNLQNQFSNMPAPQATDLTGVYDRFGQLENRLNSLPTPQATDLTGVYDRFGQLESQFGNLQNQFSNMPAPQPTDLSGIQSQLGALQTQFSNMPAPQGVDLSGLQNQISGLQNQISNMPTPQAADLSGITAQLNELQALYSSLANPSNVTAPSVSGGSTPSNLDTGGYFARGGAVNMSDGAFVVDARTVSELGNGSSNAGMELLARMGGKPLHGPGDGVSDSIPARIGGKQEARVARDEVIFPPEAVKRMGKGSEAKGTAKLYALMDKAHKARKKAKRGEDTGVRKGLA